jgi:hypothetical protein
MEFKLAGRFGGAITCIMMRLTCFIRALKLIRAAACQKVQALIFAANAKPYAACPKLAPWCLAFIRLFCEIKPIRQIKGKRGFIPL